MQFLGVCRLNLYLFLNQTGKTPIKDMFTDLKDGRRLLDLLEGLTGSVLVSCWRKWSREKHHTMVRKNRYTSNLYSTPSCVASSVKQPMLSEEILEIYRMFVLWTSSPLSDSTAVLILWLGDNEWLRYVKTLKGSAVGSHSSWRSFHKLASWKRDSCDECMVRSAAEWLTGCLTFSHRALSVLPLLKR